MLHRGIGVLLAVGLAVSFGGAARAGNGGPTERQIQQFLIDIPTAQGALDDAAKLNEEAHYPGSPGDRDMAVWMRDQLRSYGFDATIEPVKAQVPQLKRAVLQLLERPTVDFDLRETPIAADPDGTRPDAVLPFNAWSGSGDVTAPVVYVNQGVDADYAALKAAGVAVAGRIALIRYGAEFRGDLARRAMDRGAVGAIFYSDPAGPDGANHGNAYPDGPYRPLGSVQRGSVGYPILKIPVLPVTALTARRILQAIQGAAPPAAWRGGLDAQYELGATHVPVHLRVDESYAWVTLWNTIGILTGEDSSHRIILGGHRDAWVYGVTDNGAGISTLLEAARALGYIYRSGWRPHSSIVIAGWDGEEIGEAGSNSYVRTHYAELSHGCIAYVNADENVTGNFFAASAVAALSSVVPPLTRIVPDPHERTRTLWEKWRAQEGGVQIQPPGGGSDHEPFLDLVGIPVMETGFYGTFGVYHSSFDDLRYAQTQADPNFVDHRAAAQLLALIAVRMSQNRLPYNLAAYVPEMRDALAHAGTSNGTGADLKPLSQAIDRFAAAETQWERRGPSGGAAIEAVHRLNVLFYGQAGYASVAFPKLGAALASGDAAATQRAVGETAGALDAVTAVLRQ
jgi:N-acetylated-alpha-linked acidic dipeptidase